MVVQLRIIILIYRDLEEIHDATNATLSLWSTTRELMADDSRPYGQRLVSLWPTARELMADDS